MYTSSSTTFFYRYYLPLVMIALAALVYLFTDVPFDDLVMSALLVVFGFSPIQILLFRKLRHVKAMHDKLISTTMAYEEEIQYDQIEYVYQSSLIKPVIIKISYRDELGKFNQFYTLGSFSEQAAHKDPFRKKEAQLTKFIRRKAKASQSNYNEERESAGQNIPVILLCSLIMLIAMILFLELS
ncbi:MAG: hypothetical protein R8G66_16560 [Cytophagales bacterium]|nr:hypothetical protein [Cytophagales bacterium]